MTKRLNITVTLLLTNFGLLLVIAYLYKQRHPAPPDDPVAAGRAGVSTPRALPVPPVRIVKTNINAFRWAQLESDDYRAYIEHLRAIGCPESTIRDLILADIDRLFAPHLRALNPHARELAYWQVEGKEFESAAQHLERQRLQRDLDFAKRQVLQDLLGIDAVAERTKALGTEDTFGRRLGFLPEDKRNQVRMVIEQFTDEELALRRKTWEDGENLTDDDTARLKQLQEQREAAIAKLLTPAELEQYALAQSPLAYRVRDSLFGMNPNEQEYLALFGLQKSFEAKWPQGAPPPLDLERRAEWEQARAELEAGVRDKLGETRYAEYVRAQDPDFRELAVVSARFQLAGEAAGQVYEYKQAVLEELGRLDANNTLTPEQRQAARRAMSIETERAVQGVLGEKPYRAYLRSGQGAWIQGATAP